MCFIMLIFILTQKGAFVYQMKPQIEYLQLYEGERKSMFKSTVELVDFFFCSS